MESSVRPLARLASHPRLYLSDLQRIEDWCSRTGASRAAALRLAVNVGLDQLERRLQQEAA